MDQPTMRGLPGCRARRLWFARLRVLAVTVVMAALAFPVAAQTPVTGSVSGYVTDDQGQALPGVSVTLSGEDRETSDDRTTNASGYFIFPTVQPGRYTLNVALDGFQESEYTGLDVRPNAKLALDISLPMAAAVTEAVTVVARTPALETTETAIKKTVSYEEFDNLPILARDFQSVVDTLPGVTKTGPNFNVGGSRATQNIFLIDGARNDDLTDTSSRFRNSLYFIVGSQNPDDPAVGLDTGFAIQSFNQDAIAEIQVVSSAYSAEYGQGSGGVINLITRSGTDTWRGGFTFNFQDESLLAGDAFDDLRRTQESVFAGGPISRGKAWFFASYERDDYRVGWDNRRIAFPGDPTGGMIRSFVLDTDLPQSDTSKNRLTTKATFQLSSSNILNVTLNYITDSSEFNSAINRPSVEHIEPRLGDNKSYSILLNDFHTFDNEDSLYSVFKFTDLNRETRTGLANAVDLLDIRNRIGIEPPPIVGEQPIIWSVGPGGGLVFTDFYVLGSFGETLTADIATMQLKETYTRFSGDHAIKVGFDWQRFDEDLFVPARDLYVSDNRDASFNVIPIDGVPGPEDLTIFFATGTPADQRTDVRLNLFSAFAQDDWQISPRWTVNLGVRYDYDDFLENHEFSPRVHTSYVLTDDGRLLLRAGAGVFRDRANLLATEERTLIRSRGINFDRATGEVVSGSNTVPDQNVFLTDDFTSPVTYQANIGLEYDLGNEYVIGGNLIYKDFDNLVWTKVINEAPLSGPPPDPTIPANSRLIGNFGVMRDTSFEVTLRKRFRNGSFFNVNYTYEDTNGNTSQLLAARNETVIDNFLEAPDQETLRHPADFEVKHALKFSGNANLPYGVRFGSILKIRTGRPWTPEERIATPRAHFVAPEGINARNLPGEFQWDVSLAKSFDTGRTGVIEVYADFFNLTNHENVRSVQQIVTFANFAEPTSFLLPRTVQIGAKLRF